MKHWIITDTHFDHESCIEWCGRPKDFEEKIIKNSEQIVKDDDVFIHIGDISFGNNEFWNKELATRVKGKHWLVRGNHDSNSDTWYLRNGWDMVCDSFTLEKFGVRILFSHIPQEDKGQYDINVHGHFHNSDHRKKEPELNAILNDKQILIAVEYTNYSPVNLQKIIQKKVG